MQRCILSLSLHSLPMSLTLSPPSSPHIPGMLQSSGDKVSTAEVTTRCNRYPSPQPPPPPNDATPPPPVYYLVVCLWDARQHKHN